MPVHTGILFKMQSLGLYKGHLWDKNSQLKCHPDRRGLASASRTGLSPISRLHQSVIDVPTPPTPLRRGSKHCAAAPDKGPRIAEYRGGDGEAGVERRRVRTTLLLLFFHFHHFLVGAAANVLRLLLCVLCATRCGSGSAPIMQV